MQRMGATWSIITNPSAEGEARLANMPPCLIGTERVLVRIISVEKSRRFVTMPG